MSLVVDLVVKNAKIVFPSGCVISGCVAVDEEKIVAICRDSLAPAADRIVNAEGRVLMPGVIDAHTHLGLYGSFEHDFATESASASVGGVTSLINYYRTTKSYKETFPLVRDAAGTNSMIDFSFHLALVNDLQLSELWDYLTLFGITSFKLHLDYKVTGLPMTAGPEISIDDGFIYRVLEKMGTMNPAVKACTHCENPEIIRDLTKKYATSGSDLRAWEQSRPGFTEAESLNRMLYLSQVSGASIHIVHVSSKESVTVLSEARKRQMRFEAETQIHYLTQTQESPAGVFAKVKPPLRSQEDLEAVWRGVVSGLITSVSSDHVPNTKSQKIGSGGIWSASMGFPVSPLILPLLISEGFHKGRVTLDEVTRITSYNAAKSFNLYPRKGSMEIGSDADLVLLDLHKKQKVTTELLKSGSDYNIYEGWEVEGWPVMTLVRGRVVFEEGEIIANRGYGIYLPRNTGHSKDNSGRCAP